MVTTAKLAAATFQAFPPIEKHGVVGDCRTAALVAADGTIDWLCLPDYDDGVVLGALIDPQRGGHCRFGPENPSLGDQRYEKETACLQTRWAGVQGALELTDFMLWPERERPKPQEKVRVLVRALRAVAGSANVRFELRPRWTFAGAPAVQPCDDGISFQFGAHVVTLWTSFPVAMDEEGAFADFALTPNEEAWVVFALDQDPIGWNVRRCREAHEQTKTYWQDWAAGLKSFPAHNPKLRRCAMTVHLLAHARNSACVAALTTSLPERRGGDRNYDYRYTWVRDASLSVGFLAQMGKLDEVSRYLTWLCALGSDVRSPLQVCYRTNGAKKLPEREVEGVAGYCGSVPVRFGNRAYRQRQLGSLGWFADAALIFLEEGGEWRPEYCAMVRRVAEYVCGAWGEEDSGIWELNVHAHYVASKVMSWVVLDRAIRIQRLLGRSAPEKWIRVSLAVRDQVLARGWSEAKRSYRQRYESDALDAAALLIPLMNFLPPDDARVLATLDAIDRELVVDGLVHRFDPTATLGGAQLPLAEFEGAFLPCTFWYAHALAGAGRTDQARAVLRRCEEIAGEPGLFAEEADGRRRTFLGNTPLLFSQVEYARAILALERSSL